MTVKSNQEGYYFAYIPSRRYFTIGEVSELCEIKPHVLRYWEQEFPQLKPIKRKGNRRYYQKHDIVLIRQIANLLYRDGFTISGAKQKLSEPEANQVVSAQATQANPISEMIVELQQVLQLLSR